MTSKSVLKALPWLIIAIVVATALTVGAHRHPGPILLSDQARTIAAGVRCPTCEGETAADSQVFAAKAIRSDIATRLHAGQTAAQIRAYLVSRYGPGILESPPTSGFSALLWGTPLVVVPLAALALIAKLRRSNRRQAPLNPATDEDRTLVDQALQRQAARPDDVGEPSQPSRSPLNGSGSNIRDTTNGE